MAAIVNHRWVLFALIAFNLAVKLLWLGAQELAHDEPFTLYWSQRPAAEFKDMLLTENNPPLHFLITRWWSKLVPFEAGWLRMPSAVFSALAVWPLWLSSRKLGGDRVALVSALLFSLSNYHYGYAHELRGYALFTLLACWSAWLLIRRSGEARVGWVPLLQLALVNAAMVYTHYFGWLMVGVQALMVFLVPGLRAWRGSFAVSVLIAAVLFGPMAAVFLKRAATSLAAGTWLTHPVPEELYNQIWKWSNAPVLAVAFLVVIAMGIVRSRGPQPAMRAAFIWGLVPLFGLYLVSQWKPMFLDRYLVFAAPGFAVLVAVSIEALRLPARWTTLCGAAATLGMALTFVPWRAGVYQPSRVAVQVEAWCGNECHVEVVPPWYWLNLKAAEGISNLKGDLSHLLDADVLFPDSGQAAALGSYLLVDASGTGQGDALRDHLRQRYPLMDEVEADHRVRVFRFHAGGGLVAE